MVNTKLGDKLVVTKTDEMLATGSELEQQKGGFVLVKSAIVLMFVW